MHPSMPIRVCVCVSVRVCVGVVGISIVTCMLHTFACLHTHACKNIRVKTYVLTANTLSANTCAFMPASSACVCPSCVHVSIYKSIASETR